MFVLTNGELKSYILKITDQWFGLTSVQIAVAVLVAILGIVNTLTVSITDRRRELGVLQAVGGLHGQIRRTIWLEALSIGVLGLALGFALGAVNLYYILQIVHHDIAGMRLDYVVPGRHRARRWCRRFSARRSSRRSGRRSRRCTARWWRRSSMSRAGEEMRSGVAEDEARGAPGSARLSLHVFAADNARQIVDEAQKRTEAKSQRYEGLLQVFDAKGKISDKRWTLERLGSHGQSKAVLRFTAPAEVKGVALLIVNHPDRASDQWMWTPAIERDRRIALQDRSTRFFGTDFSFEDLEERDVDQYEYALLGEEAIDGAPCWKIQSTPREAKASQYTRSIVWMRKDNYAFARIENYVKDQVVRRLNYSEHPERPGHLDRQAARDDRPAPRQPHAADARQAANTTCRSRKRTSRCRRSAGSNREVATADRHRARGVPGLLRRHAGRGADALAARLRRSAGDAVPAGRAAQRSTRRRRSICWRARRSSSSRPPGCSLPPASTCAQNTHDQVDDSWRVDFTDRGTMRPAMSVRRLVRDARARPASRSTSASSSSAGARPTSSRRPTGSRPAIS